MTRRDQHEWVSGQKAAEIISKKSGHTIKQNYVRLLAINGKIAQRQRDGRTNEYRLSDVETIKVRTKTSKQTPAASWSRHTLSAPPVKALCLYTWCCYGRSVTRAVVCLRVLKKRLAGDSAGWTLTPHHSLHPPRVLKKKFWSPPLAGFPDRISPHVRHKTQHLGKKSHKA